MRSFAVRWPRSSSTGGTASGRDTQGPTTLLDPAPQCPHRKSSAYQAQRGGGVRESSAPFRRGTSANAREALSCHIPARTGDPLGSARSLFSKHLASEFAPIDKSDLDQLVGT